jgi:hypothetical protein
MLRYNYAKRNSGMSISKVEKMQVAVTKDTADLALRLIAGSALGVAATLGVGAMLGVIAGVAVISFVSQQTQLRYSKKSMLDAFSDEVSALVGKPEKSLTIKDLAHAAALSKQNGSPMLSDALRGLEVRKWRSIGVNLVTMAATAALVVAAPVAANIFNGLLPSNLATNLANFGSAFTFYLFGGRLVDSIANTLLPEPPGGVALNIARIAKEVRDGDELKPERLFGLMLQANPKLKKQAESMLHKNFDDFSLADRRQVIAELQLGDYLTQVAEQVNTGKVRAQELGFIVYGQQSGVPQRHVPPVTPPVLDFKPDPASEKAHAPAISFTERVKQAQQTPQSGLLLN